MSEQIRPSCRHRTTSLFAAIVVSILVAGCSTTTTPEPTLVERMEGTTPTLKVPAGFFGNEAPLLKPGKNPEALLYYVNPKAHWTTYHQVIIDPVQFWDSADSSISPDDQKMLTSYLYSQLQQALAKDFTVVDKPGPGVLTVQVAIISATAATPGMRSVSEVVPQIHALNTLQSLATGSLAFVGSAEGAMKFTDSQSGELLAAAVNKRLGGGNVESADQLQWGDAENIMQFWAQEIAKRLKQATTSGSILPQSQQ
jgi:hypothetical protein